MARTIQVLDWEGASSAVSGVGGGWLDGQNFAQFANPLISAHSGGGQSHVSMGRSRGPGYVFSGASEGAKLPSVGIKPAGPPQGPADSEADVGEILVSQGQLIFFPPEYLPKKTEGGEVGTVPVGAPSGRQWDPSGVLSGPAEGDTVNTSIDWGDVVVGALRGAAGWDPFGAQAAMGDPFGFVQTQPVGGGAMVPPPKKVTVDTQTGKVTPCRRTRAKKILTQTNFGMILQISTLPNNANVRIALAKAIK